ncbi:ATP-binding protein [Streptomyces nondiastaticus]|uniref:ATP-binding protein n=1 Tax=Streptomyces nondiastaticus TaxID=3154512 RepID=UPI0034361CD6
MITLRPRTVRQAINDDLAAGASRSGRPAAATTGKVVLGRLFAEERHAVAALPVRVGADEALREVRIAIAVSVVGPAGIGLAIDVIARARSAAPASWKAHETKTWHQGAPSSLTITRAHLIILDDICMLPSGQAAAEAFYRVIDAAYDRRSVIVTSNLHPSGFDTIRPKTLATAAVDRLLHHTHIILTEGTSLRLTQATTGKGVVPLTS